MPERIARDAGFIFPPRVAAPPPPFPVPHVTTQPLPVLHVLLVYLPMVLLQMGIYFKIELF